MKNVLAPIKNWLHHRPSWISGELFKSLDSLKYQQYIQSRLWTSLQKNSRTVCVEIYIFMVLYFSILFQKYLHSLCLQFRCFRFVAYYSFVSWCWGFLAARVRVVIPSCAVLSMQQEFLDPVGYYVGYQPVNFLQPLDWIRRAKLPQQPPSMACRIRTEGWGDRHPLQLVLELFGVTNDLIGEQMRQILL